MCIGAAAKAQRFIQETLQSQISWVHKEFCFVATVLHAERSMPMSFTTNTKSLFHELSCRSRFNNCLRAVMNMFICLGVLILESTFNVSAATLTRSKALPHLVMQSRGPTKVSKSGKRPSNLAGHLLAQFISVRVEVNGFPLQVTRGGTLSVWRAARSGQIVRQVKGESPE